MLTVPYNKWQMPLNDSGKEPLFWVRLRKSSKWGTQEATFDLLRPAKSSNLTMEGPLASGSSRSSVLGSDREDPFDIPSERMVPLPPGEYTVLPIVEACDNCELPRGPWDARSLKQRLVAHQQKRITAAVTSSTISESAVDDDEDDEEANEEFLTPFFLSLPVASTASTTASRSLSRRSSSHRPSFSFTPVNNSHVSLRSSSPTPSHSSVPARTVDPKTASSAPIGFLRPQIVEALLLDNAKMVQMGVRPAWQFLPPVDVPAKAPPQMVRRRSSASSRRPSNNLGMTASAASTPAHQSGANTPATASETLAMKDVLADLKRMDVGTATPYAVAFADWVNEEGREARKEQMDRVARAWKMKGDYPDVLGGEQIILKSAEGFPGRS